MPVSTEPGFIMITASGMPGGVFTTEEAALASAQYGVADDHETRTIIPCTLITYTPEETP